MTITSTFVKTCFLSVLLFLGIQVLAAPSVGVKPAPSWVIPVVPAGKAASPKDFSEGYYLSFSEMQYNLDKKATYQRFIRQITSENGIQNGSEISITFDPLYEHVDFHDISVWRNGKRIPQMNLSEFKVLPLETDRQRFIYNGYYSASLILKDIRKGDKVEVSYTRTGWNPVFQNKFSNILSFYTYDYISHVHYAIIAKKGRTLFLKDVNKPPLKTVRPDQENDIYEWDLKNVKKVAYDDNTPDWYSKHPFVEVSEYKNWQEVVDWGLNFYQTPVISGALKAKVDEWKRSSTSTFQFIEKAVRFVQDEIRYLGIETGENSHRPHNPEDVFRQRYGDCKDKAFLLCAIMKANDIECDPLLIDTYKRAHLSEYLPSPTNFNHVVVRIRTRDKGPKADDPGDFVFIDATISLQGGALSTINFPAYGEGLLLKKGQIKPISIPLQNSGSMTVTEDLYLPSKTDSSAKGLLQVKTVYFQGDADIARSFFQDAVISETEQSYLNYYRDTYDHAQLEISDTMEFYDQREAGNFSMVERYSMKNVWRLDSVSGKHVINIFGKQLYDQLVLLPNRPRKDPVHLKYPYHNTYTIRLHMPGAWNVPSDSWKVERAAYKASFKSAFIAAENVWELSYDYETLQDYVAVEQVGQFKSDMEKLVKDLEYQLTAPGENVVNNDNINWAILLFSLTVVLACLLFFEKLYKRYSPLSGQCNESAINVGGWLILIGISISLQPFVMLGAMFTNSASIYFTKSGWNVFEGQGTSRILGYHALMIFELFFNLVLISYAVLLIFLFYRKRDSFPILYPFFLAMNLLFLMIDAALSYTLFEGNQDESMTLIFRQFIAAAIWIPYMYKSVRVKQTFVNTYGGQPLLEPVGDSAIVDDLDIES